LKEDALINLASERLGARALSTNDEFFAAKENLCRDDAPVANDEYTDRGKWMDGWETRRRREPGFDWCVIRLGARGIIGHLIVDTTHFKGNHPPECSVEALDAPGVELPPDAAQWFELLPRAPLAADSLNSFESPDEGVPVTHLRLNIFPDGGVARLRALGRVVPDLAALRAQDEVNVAAIQNGAVVMRCSDMFFGHRQNLLMPGRAWSMRDGWETRRRRGPGHDWAVVRLAAPATIHRIEVDTSHFKGNAPGSCSLDAVPAGGDDSEGVEKLQWQPLVDRTPLSPHTNHVLRDGIRNVGPVSHVRLNIFPDGGVSRLLVWGRLA
jgi:allantoicase